MRKEGPIKKRLKARISAKAGHAEKSPEESVRARLKAIEASCVEIFSSLNLDISNQPSTSSQDKEKNIEEIESSAPSNPQPIMEKQCLGERSENPQTALSNPNTSLNNDLHLSSIASRGEEKSLDEEPKTVQRYLEVLNETINVWAEQLLPNTLGEAIKTQRAAAAIRYKKHWQREQAKHEMESNKLMMRALSSTSTSSSQNTSDASAILASFSQLAGKFSDLGSRMVDISKSAEEVEVIKEKKLETVANLFELHLSPELPIPEIIITKEQFKDTQHRVLKKLKQAIRNSNDEIIPALKQFYTLLEKILALLICNTAESVNSSKEGLDFVMVEKLVRIAFWLDEKGEELKANKRNQALFKQYKKNQQKTLPFLTQTYGLLAFALVHKASTSLTDLSFSQRFLEIYEKLDPQVETHTLPNNLRKSLQMVKVTSYCTKARLAYAEKHIENFLFYIEKAKEQATRSTKSFVIPLFNVLCTAGKHFKETSPTTSLEFYQQALTYAKCHQQQLNSAFWPLLKIYKTNAKQEVKELEERLKKQRQAALKEIQLSLKEKYQYGAIEDKQGNLYLFISREKNSLSWEKCQQYQSPFIEPNLILTGATQDVIKIRLKENKDSSLQKYEQAIQRLFSFSAVSSLSSALPTETSAPTPLAADDFLTTIPATPSKSQESTPETSFAQTFPEVTKVEEKISDASSISTAPKTKIKTRGLPGAAYPHQPPAVNAPLELRAQEVGFTSEKNAQRSVTPLYLNLKQQKEANPLKADIFIAWQGIKGLPEKEELRFKEMLNTQPRGIQLAPPRGKSGAKFHRHPNHLGENWSTCGLRFKDLGGSKRVPCKAIERVEVADAKEGETKTRYLFALGKKPINK